MSIAHRLMLLNTFILALWTFPGAPQGVNLTCFNGGLVGDCSSFIDTFCTSTHNINVMLENSASQCFAHPDGFRCDLSAWRALSTGSAMVDLTACNEVLSTASATCSVGGSGITTTGHFVYTIRPNNGACGDDSAIPNE